ncbi:lipase protein [Rutstroemia sp. NJR-2017a BVV2]|nr:lipase protein [Rutstroemia sp. NJR-2017a BVV2]
MALPRFVLICIVKFIRLFTTTLASPLRRLLRLPYHPPTYSLTIPATFAQKNPGNLTLYIYHPPSYDSSRTYPCILSFHGGGFTIGHPTDDSLWAQTVTNLQNCIVISASYRLGPEHPFPTAIQDACSSLIYLFSHSRELNIDPTQIVLSGFSAGGNLCFSAPLLLREFKSLVSVEESWNIAGIIAFYPGLDSSISRQEKRLRMANPSQSLPGWLTDVFDHSYRPPNTGIDRRSKFLSPGIQDERILREALPAKIRIVTCEYDMLCREAEDFVQRLGEWGWKVDYECVRGVKHAWDKYPSPTPDPREYYGRAGDWLRAEVWGEEEE